MKYRRDNNSRSCGSLEKPNFAADIFLKRGRGRETGEDSESDGDTTMDPTRIAKDKRIPPWREQREKLIYDKAQL